MRDLGLLLTFWSVFAVAVVSPGPNFALLASIGLREGRRRALGTAVGLVMGEAVWGITAVFGVSALALRYPALGAALRIAGGLFLIYLGIGAIRAAFSRRAPAEAPTPPPPRTAGIGRGFVLMLLNPKAGVFWVSLSGLFLGESVSHWTAAMGVAGAVLLSLAWHLLLAWMFSADRLARTLARLSRVLDGALGGILTAIGIKLVAFG